MIRKPVLVPGGMTEQEVLDLRARVHYAVGTQFGEVAPRGREGAIYKQMFMFINDLLRAREALDKASKTE